jgi:hypothetical protein
MFHEHYVFKVPADRITIWRYTTWGRLCDLLVRSALFFPRAMFFDDKWEATYPASQYTIDSTAEEWPRLAYHPSETVDEVHKRKLALLRTFEEGRRTLGVSCWHMADGESDMHWRIYGRSDEGVAIRSTVGQMKMAFDSNRDRAVHIGEVRYVDFSKVQFPSNNGFWPIMHKRLAFQNDKELRAVVWESGAEGPFDKKGVHVAVDVPALIQEVVISPIADTSRVDTVCDIVRRFGHSFPIRRSTLLDPPSHRTTP